MEISEQIVTEKSHGISLPRPNLSDLPTELHMQVAGHLSYPDALALKHTCRHFYSIVYTGVHLKVNWLVERFERKLECPMEKCSFRTDEAFCNWRIRRIMERRRLHLECRHSVGGCSVVEGQTCQVALVTSWLKMQRRGRLMQNLVGWGREAFVVAVFAMILEILWKFSMHFWSG